MKEGRKRNFTVPAQVDVTQEDPEGTCLMFM